MNQKAKERRAILDQALTARASIGPSERPALAPRQLGPIAEQANLQVEHVATRAKAFDEAKAQGRLLFQLDPAKIRATEFRNRHELSLLANDARFAELKESLQTHGQETPIRVRPIKGPAPYEFEVVSGHRRHAACLALDGETPGGFRILAIVDAKAADARDLVLKMYRENQERSDLSAFETGSMFRQWLAAEIYSTQREIVAATGLAENTVSQYLTIANLPAEVLEAFGDVRQISLRWNVALAKVCKEQKAETLARARKLAKYSPRPDAETVYKALIAGALTGRKNVRGSKSESVKVNNKTLFTASLRAGKISMTPKQLSADKFAAAYEFLKASFQRWLDENGGQGRDAS